MSKKLTKCSEVRIPVPWGFLAGRWYGDQMRRPILAIHGYMDNCGSFATLAPLLTPYCSLLCIDLPGHGHSSHLPIGMIYNRQYYDMLLLHIMETYKWKKISLLGHSMGGSIIFDFASYYPSRVDLIISIDSVNNRYGNSLDLHPDLISLVIDRAVIENDRLLNTSAKAQPPTYTFEELEHVLFNGSNQSVQLEKCKYLLERSITLSRKHPKKYNFSRDNRVKACYSPCVNNELLREMTTRICRAELPYIVIKAGESEEIDENTKMFVNILLQHNRRFEYHELPDETHHLHLNNPERVAKLIIAFLQKNPQEQISKL